VISAWTANECADKEPGCQNEDGSNCSPSDDDEDDLKYGDIATLPHHLKENRKKKKLMVQARKTNTRQTTGTHNKGGKAIPLEPQ